MSTKMEEIIKKLKAPFPFEETIWKVQATNGDKTRGLAVVYIDSRAIQNRLDEVVGPFDWQNEYKQWQDKAQICGISIYDEARQLWTTKFDGAENTDYEPVKGGLSDSFKRAAVMWGLGRYLYDIDSIWVEIETKGKSSYIKDSEKAKLKTHYNKFVGSLNRSEVLNGGKQTPAPDKAPPQKAQPNKAAKEPPKQTDTVQYDYKIQSAAETGNSTCLKLLNKEGKELTVYVKKGSPGIKAGACIKNAAFDKKEAPFGTYYTLNKYEVAA